MNKIKSSSILYYNILSLIICWILICCFSTLVCAQEVNKKYKIGVIVPIEHLAMEQIIDGIRVSLESSNVELIVKNAHGDMGMMLSIINNFKDKNIDIFMPIGTSTCQMNINNILDKAVVCVASDINSKYKNVVNINDEISISKSLTILPELKKIALIYSASEKVIKEVEALKVFAKDNNIIIYPIMVQTLAEMPILIRKAPNDVNAFLILKDHLIVSGINMLNSEVQKRNIPLIASDEGSVYNGATIAIGVRERDIGIKAGEIVNMIVGGFNIENIENQSIDKLVLFLNNKSLKKQNIIDKSKLSKIALPVVEF